MEKTDLGSIVSNEKTVKVNDTFKEGFIDGVNQWQYFYIHGKTPKQDYSDLDGMSNAYQLGWFASMPINVPSLALMMTTGWTFELGKAALIGTSKLAYNVGKSVVKEIVDYTNTP